jgi:THO complex subunit 2
MIRYVVHQLQNGLTTELVVWREIIRNMAGISPLPSLTDSQIIAMAGGPYLRIEAIASASRGARLDPGDMTVKGPHRLGRALVDSQLAQTLLIQIAQHRERCVHQPPTPNAPLKSLASLYDTVSPTRFTSWIRLIFQYLVSWRTTAVHRAPRILFRHKLE